MVLLKLNLHQSLFIKSCSGNKWNKYSSHVILSTVPSGASDAHFL